MRSRLFWYLIAMWSVAGAAGAFTVSPVAVEMRSAGPHARAQFTITNNSTGDLPVEPTVERISIDESGKLTKAPAGDEFLILPMQALVPPGGSQTFRVQWLGEPDLAKSESYFISFNELPVAGLKKTGVQIITSIATAVNVAPPAGVGTLAVAGTSIVSKDGKSYAAVTLKNTSHVHALLKYGNLAFAAGPWSATLDSTALAKAFGNGLVQPDAQRRFVTPVVVPSTVKSFSARVEYAPPSK